MSERLTVPDGTAADAGAITELLKRWSAGDASARDELIPLVYNRLRRLAHERLYFAPGEHSLNTTALVHETYLRLADARALDLPSRARFLSLASQVMRNLLIDHIRARRAARRGGEHPLVELREEVLITDAQADAIDELHDALSRLQEVSPRQSALLQFRYFGGLTLEESAIALGVSLATAKRELRSARAWLALELGGEPLS